MSMNFDLLKIGFDNYLQSKLEGKEKEEYVSDPDYNIFKYGDEFKTYLIDEVGADSSIMTKNISEIFQMDFVNGKFVDPKDENSDKFEKTEDSEANGNVAAQTAENTEGAAGSEQVEGEQAVPPQGDSADSGNADFMTSVVNQFISDETIQSYLDADIDGNLSEDEVNQFLYGLSDKKTGDLNFDAFSKMSQILNSDNPEEILNQLYNEKSIMDLVDSDLDNELSSEEKEKFENYIKSYDGNVDDMTADDLKRAYVDVINGKFELPEDEKVDDKKAEEDKSEEKADDISSETPSSKDVSSPVSNGANSASPAQGSSGVSGGNPTNYSNGVSSGGNYSSAANNAPQGIEGMSLEELKKEQATRQSDFDKAKQGVKDVQSGENENVKKAQEGADDAKAAYDKAVEEDTQISDELKQRRTDNLNAIEAKESEISDLDSQITEKNSQISAQTSAVADAQSNLDSLNAAKNALPNPSEFADNPEKKKEIAEKKAELEKKIPEAEKKLAAEKDKLEKLKTPGLSDLETQKTKAENELKDLKEEKANIEEEITANCSQQTKDAMKAYNDAKDNVDKVKAEELKTAESKMTEAQKALDEINEAIRKKESQKTEKDYKVSKFNSSLPDEFAERLDNKLGDGFCEKLEEICEEIGCQPEDLIGLMYSESGIDPHCQGYNGATGLIQFLPSTARGMGYTTDQLKNMSAVEQLDVVEKFLKSNLKSTGNVDAGTLYASVFLPAYQDRDVLCRQGESNGYYKWNSGVDLDKNGDISKTDLTNRIHAKYQEALQWF